MAGPWIKVEHSSIDKPEIVEMSGMLDIDHDAVFGKCVRFWIWADQQTQDGDALRVTAAFIDRLVFCPGFANAIRKVGWLDGRDGRYSIPNFSDHNGQSAKKRGMTQKRTEKYRNKRDETVTPEPSPDKRRIDKSKEREREVVSDGVKIPKSLNTEPFLKIWESYHSWWLAETGSRLNPIRAQQTLDDLYRRGHDKSIEDLKLTMRSSTKPGTVWDSTPREKAGSSRGDSISDAINKGMKL